MKTTASGTTLFQLTQLGAINCYLVREDDGFTLIDTASSGQAQPIIQAAAKLGLPIVRIVLTHAHSDHVGSLDALHAALPTAQVAISERDARFLTGDQSLDPSEPQTRLHGGYPICQTKPTLLLHEGDRIGSLEVIATPGHTPGHISFLDTRNRSLIVGDAFQTLGGVAVAGTIKPLFPLPALATWNKDLCLASARKLLALQPSVLSVGHGRMLNQPQAAMERAIHILERALAHEHEHEHEHEERKASHVA
ncbi:MBL fold metallo-hydrolase [Ktedonobacteria bacterium brp13]|nr:MBL fold metallo-hydrolase [Ktedonobacteria bacterium brp13]